VKRRLFNFAALLSLSFAILMAGLWARSHWIKDLWKLPLPVRYASLESYSGFLGFSVSFSKQIAQPDWNSVRAKGFVLTKEMVSFQESRHEPPSATFRFTGVMAAGYLIGVPHWFVCLLCLLLPAVWWWRRWRFARARERGLCPKCGYDLRASPDRCPECGQQIDPGAKPEQFAVKTGAATSRS
jgi:hypothetical protein